MIRLSTKAIASVAAGVTLAGAGVTTALAYGGTSEAAASPQAQSAPAKVAQQAPAQAEKRVQSGAQDRMLLSVKKGNDPKKQAKAPALPTGVSTATSFWDPSTASGKPMAYETIASPYWPLGTKVKVTYNGKSEIGIVEDFGPAEWAVAQHNPPALIDLSEKMMKHLTGTASNSITVKFQVLELGKGPVYRHSGTGYATATGAAQATGKA
ncbi:septal ring lytic transglycosylase RlpA family protein [Actinoallomurus rhizosphaericola]|uniref:septal ring lytic transglycosylase RlpA family protein n=1 Tax=Actinoallomurus rhizosphaericola TaxID=2952536 RepID=UPI0020918CF3|nr:septal ring lytic transglycosylase RlpA family protein [Actinoallomurus rhizosphaericola]MCO5993447.1 septal ring lytic transglycosylase RlpA family protein [Actinoallomurus rhizosphaericola]